MRPFLLLSYRRICNLLLIFVQNFNEYNLFTVKLDGWKSFRKQWICKKIFAYSGIIRDYEGYDPISLTASFFHEDVGYFMKIIVIFQMRRKCFLTALLSVRL